MSSRKPAYDVERLFDMSVREELRIEYMPDHARLVDDIRYPSRKNAHGFGYTEGSADGAIHVAG